MHRSFALTNVWVNPLLIPLLEGRAGRRLGRQLAVVEYVGRRSGNPNRLVAQYVRHGRTVRIRVGAADRKTWWRNFSAGYPLRLHLAGDRYDATAHVVRGDDDVAVIAELEDLSP
jgi:hypothetical protein